MGNSIYAFQSPTTGSLLTVGTSMEAWMVVWAETSPDIQRYERGGPAWTYLREKKSLVAEVHFTTWTRDGRRAYWHGHGARRPEPPTAFKVIQEHARINDVDAVLFDANFLDERSVEARNRMHAHALLRCSRAFDSSALETGVATKLGKGPQRVSELMQALDATEAQVTLAAVRLWLARRADLPTFRDHLLSSRLTVRRRHDGA